MKMLDIANVQSYMYVPFQDKQFDEFIVWLIPNSVCVFLVLLLFVAEQLCTLKIPLPLVQHSQSQ